MNFAHPKLCQVLYELTGKPAYWAWYYADGKPTIIHSSGVYGNGVWPAYALGELYRMNPRATTWFKKETPRLGGMFSARTDSLPHYTARNDSPEDAAAVLQIAYAQSRRRST